MPGIQNKLQTNSMKVETESEMEETRSSAEEETKSSAEEETRSNVRRGSHFYTEPGFCPDCGTILPVEVKQNTITCYGCKRVWSSEVFHDMAHEYTLLLNSRVEYMRKKRENRNTFGPTIARDCPKCENKEMAFVALQTRSIDEGQTIFYTCTKCQFREMEHS